MPWASSRAARSGKKEYKAASDSEGGSDDDYTANSEFEVSLSFSICCYAGLPSRLGLAWGALRCLGEALGAWRGLGEALGAWGDLGVALGALRCLGRLEELA